MRYEEITVTEPFEMSPHRHAFMNPYNGCSMGCPFCYWLSQEGWEGRIQIKKNLSDVLEPVLKTWPKDEFLYLGSVCDPFNELEQVRGLTGKCLELIDTYQLPLVITTSAVHEVLSEYAEKIRNMKQRVIVVVELARIPEIERLMETGVHKGIQNANRLYGMGLEVWATLSPLCPGIIELEPVLEQLDRHIPVYIDRLRCTEGTVQGERVMEWIRRDHPEMERLYQRIICEEDTGYFEKILEQYKDSTRVKTFPFCLT